MNDVVKVSVRVDQVGPTTSEGRAREHRVVMDRPEAKGGQNRGAMGGENLLMALGGCFMSNLLAAAQARESDLTDVRLRITGTLASSPPGFTALDMKITSGCSDKELMQKLLTIAERGCIVANTLKNAVDLTIALA